MSDRRDPTDYSCDDIGLVYPELQGESLARAIAHGAFPAADYVGVDNEPYWREASILEYTNGRAAVETASGKNARLVDLIRAHGSEGHG